jgi:predicted nucleic acid-binding protein
MLVLDSGVVVAACWGPGGFEVFAGEKLHAPPLMWSEGRAVLRLGMWRGQVVAEDAERAFDRLEACPVENAEPDGLGREAWGVAAEMGWARTYDAEYVALARLLDCRLVTLDGRLRRGTDRLGFVVTPAELA